MSQDLAAILTGAPAAPSAPPKAAAPKVYDPMDAAIRTVIAEEKDPEARRWVAGVIRNRAAKKNGDILGVVQEPGQFEPWAAGGEKIAAVDPNSDDYKKTAALVGAILRGEEADPTGGATHFYAPEAQKKLSKVDGRPERAEFDDGTGIQKGSTLFFRKGEPQGAELAGLLGADTTPDPEVRGAFADAFGDPARWEGVTPASDRVERVPVGKLNPAQRKTYETFGKSGYLKEAGEEVPDGSVRNPYWDTHGNMEKDAPPGAYYVDQKGDLKRAPGGDDKSSFREGASRGVGDVMLSLGQLMPGTEDSTLRNRMEADQMAYDADFKGDLKSGMGRFTGQLAASAPLLAGGEGFLAPALARTGLGRFVLGAAGKGALPETATLAARAGQLATRGGSLAASGAAEGAGASALVSSASDEPLAEQLKTGAILGGALKPVAGAVTGGLSRFVGGNPTRGAIEPALQAEIAEKAGTLPVPMQLSKGQMTGAPGQQLAENLMLKGTEGDLAAGVVKGFLGEQQGALRQNVQAISDQMAGAADVRSGEGAKAVSEKLNAMRDVAKKGIDKAYDEARARGEDAMLATAADVREGALDGLRREYDLDRIKAVAKEFETFGEKGAPTVRELYDMRSRLSNLTQSGDDVEAGAAKKATRLVDAYIQTALKDDLFLGDPGAVKAWKDAIKKRAEFGRLFEGDDLIDGLTERVQRGGGATLKVDPEEAANYILNRSDLGWVGKKNLGRDLKRLEGVLGKNSDEWNGLRAEVFGRLARAGEGVPEGGVPQFSGQKFQKAWEKAKRDDPQVVGVMFTPDERALIDKFAEVAQVVTTPVKGGDTPPNTAVALKKLIEPMTRFLSVGGGAGGGAAIGGPPGAALGAALGFLMKDLKEVLAVGKARKATYGAKPLLKDSGLKNSLIPGSTTPAAVAIGANARPQPPADQ